MSDLTKWQQEMALRLVAEWMGREYGDGAPFPTGEDAAYRGLGPALVPDYEGCWVPQEPTPAIILEGLPGADWANYCVEALRDQFKLIGVVSEPLTGFILSLHPLRPRPKAELVVSQIGMASHPEATERSLHKDRQEARDALIGRFGPDHIRGEGWDGSVGSVNGRVFQASATWSIREVEA
ncbi:hypothetical protein SEA_ARGIE_84 [Mycobacterium phage Argie]|nr:hypothetical protein SEA_ARGIE_84 [Mycobacterium phage Argie]